MTATRSVDAAARATEDWIDDFVQRLGWRNRTRAYSALIASLHALRDCLRQSAAIYLGAQLPALPRGLYYEGWHPASRVTAKSRGARFLSVFTTACTATQESMPNKRRDICVAG